MAEVSLNMLAVVRTTTVRLREGVQSTTVAYAQIDSMWMLDEYQMR